MVETVKRFQNLSKLGCIVCRVYLQVYSEPHIHHLLGIKYRGMGLKSRDEHTLPLCPAHHQYGTNENPSVHLQPKLFAEKYGSQEELLEMTNKLLERMLELDNH